MTRTLPHSLQGRLLVLLLGLVVSVWMATAVMTWFDARQELDELLDSHLAQAAAILVMQQSHEVGEDNHEVDSPSLHRYAPKVAFQVFHEGRLALRSANAPAARMIGTGDRIESGFHTVSFDGAAWRVFATHGAEQDVQVFVGEQMTSRTSILWAVLRSALWPMLCALPLLALAIWWSVNRSVAPLRRLGRSLGERDARSLQPVTIAGAPSEMTPMVDALNDLFRRIAALMESERRFTADAAHELRTPIAAIRAQAQVAMGEQDEALRRHALQATLLGCDRATHLVTQLLTLSRLDAGSANGAKSDIARDVTSNATLVNLGELVRQVVANEAQQALRKQQHIELDASRGCIVPGDATLLAVLARNLVDNAIRYSPEGATIRVTVQSDKAGVLLRVDDSGPGLADADLQRLGERFFRVLSSSEGGSGLGWSIIQRIAAAHDATAKASRSEVLGGLCVEVTLPAPGAASNN
ncbi:two-component sensor histidine kinase [Caenimonas koreensis DSM 17982]|uniref:histidine kinase n=1 Tax=Caenimonas koreensis DSM 17982 TaxID=1121255 RepID=A0A844AS43_9BURK|nr:ATP-binding protein [Caenimonas koreensis]MRD46884.1 two-component sensor histidine kinase [Caenimonas koreensis DSM 17982]